jgi:hypothetical protein
MKKNYRLSFILLLFLISAIFVPQLAKAQDIGNTIPTSSTIFTGNLAGLANLWDSPEHIISFIFRFVITIAGTVFVILFLIGGIQYLTSAGNEDGTTKAKKMLLDAIIGLIIVLAAYAVGTYILALLGFTSTASSGTTGGSTTGTTTSQPGQLPTPTNFTFIARDASKNAVAGVSVFVQNGTDSELVGTTDSSGKFVHSIQDLGSRQVSITSSTLGGCSTKATFASGFQFITIQFNSTISKPNNNGSCSVTTGSQDQTVVTPTTTKSNSNKLVL